MSTCLDGLPIKELIFRVEALKKEQDDQVT